MEIRVQLVYCVSTFCLHHFVQGKNNNIGKTINKHLTETCNAFMKLKEN